MKSLLQPFLHEVLIGQSDFIDPVDFLYQFSWIVTFGVGIWLLNLPTTWPSCHMKSPFTMIWTKIRLMQELQMWGAKKNVLEKGKCKTKNIRSMYHCNSRRKEVWWGGPAFSANGIFFFLFRVSSKENKTKTNKNLLGVVIGSWWHLGSVAENIWCSEKCVWYMITSVLTTEIVLIQQDYNGSEKSVFSEMCWCSLYEFAKF